MIAADTLTMLDVLPLFITLLFVFGLCFGSFLNVVIYRLPLRLKHDWENECRTFVNLATIASPTLTLHRPRSFCPTCQNTIAARHNIPLFSFIWLKGRCHHCTQPISWQYPIVEILAASITILLGLKFGLTSTFIAALGFAYTLLALSVIDLKHQLLPDCLTYTLLWTGLLLNRFGFFVPIEDAVLGAAVGYVSLWLFAKAFQSITHKEGMAAGDMKLLAAMAAWQGVNCLLPIILLASLSGSIIGIFWLRNKKQTFSIAIPFGPFLAISGLITLCFTTQLTLFIPMFNL